MMVTIGRFAYNLMYQVIEAATRTRHVATYLLERTTAQLWSGEVAEA